MSYCIQFLASFIKNDQRTKDEYLKMFITYHFDTLFKLVYILNSFTYGAYLKLSILIINKIGCSLKLFFARPMDQNYIQLVSNSDPLVFSMSTPIEQLR